MHRDFFKPSSANFIAIARPNPRELLHGAVWLAIQIADQHGFRRQPAMLKRTAARIKSRFA